MRRRSFALSAALMVMASVGPPADASQRTVTHTYVASAGLWTSVKPSGYAVDGHVLLVDTGSSFRLTLDDHGVPDATPVAVYTAITPPNGGTTTHEHRCLPQRQPVTDTIPLGSTVLVEMIGPGNWRKMPSACGPAGHEATIAGGNATAGTLVITW